MVMPEVLFKRVHPAAKLPTRAHMTDAGYDLYSIDHIIIGPGERAMVRTGLQMAMPGPVSMFAGEYPHWEDSETSPAAALIGFDFPQVFHVCWEAQIRPRSGSAFKRGLTVINTPGTIDSGYRGDINVLLVNLDGESIEIRPGDKIAQMVFNLVVHPQLKVVDELPESDRGEKGFGSTGGV